MDEPELGIIKGCQSQTGKQILKTKKSKYIKMNRQANITNKEKQIYKNGQASVQRTRPIGFPGQACKTAQGSL